MNINYGESLLLEVYHNKSRGVELGSNYGTSTSSNDGDDRSEATNK
jgi:hypothetical protein